MTATDTDPADPADPLGYRRIATLVGKEIPDGNRQPGPPSPSARPRFNGGGTPGRCIQAFTWVPLTWVFTCWNGVGRPGRGDGG